MKDANRQLHLTEVQFVSLIDIMDTVSAMIGCSDKDFDKEQTRNLRNLDRMLKNNGYKRKLN